MDNEAEKQFIDHPYMNGFCDKCRNHYLLDGDESRCRSISLGMSSAMCCQISRCSKYEEKK
jgi:hypothetical protein